MTTRELEQSSLDLRRLTLQMIHAAGTSHIGSCFSIIELLTVLYGRVLRVRPSHPGDDDRDRFILSKGHAAAALYAVLAQRGFFPIERLAEFCRNGSSMAGHATHHAVPGIEVSTGSLGHGLSIGTGMALGAKRAGASYRVFVMLSDGECDEGSTWEPALFAPQHGLDNLVAIIDYNKIQSLGTVAEVINLEPLAEKWRSFGWSVVEIDGHDIDAIDRALAVVPPTKQRPTCIIAHTVKGKGVSFMENRLLWHYRTPRGEEFEAAVLELAAQA